MWLRHVNLSKTASGAFFGRPILVRKWLAKMTQMACLPNMTKMAKKARLHKIAIYGAIQAAPFTARDLTNFDYFRFMELAEIERCRASESPPQTHQGGQLSSSDMAFAVCWGCPRCSNARAAGSAGAALCVERAAGSAGVARCGKVCDPAHHTAPVDHTRSYDLNETPGILGR